MKALLILILITLWLTLCALSAGIGFLVGFRYKSKTAFKASKEPIPPTPEEIRAAQKSKRELENMLTYDGTPQDDVI